MAAALLALGNDAGASADMSEDAAAVDTEVSSSALREMVLYAEWTACHVPLLTTAYHVHVRGGQAHVVQYGNIRHMSGAE